MLLVALSAQPAGAAGDLTVHGTVLDRSVTPARPVGGLAVVLEARSGSRVVAAVQSRSDARGRFALVALPLPRGGEYALITVYRGVPYGVAMGLARAAHTVDLPVYDTTSSDAGLATMRIVLGVRRQGRGLVAIEQWSYVNAGANGGLRTDVGSDPATGRGAATFLLPPGATAVRVRDVSPAPATATVRQGSVVVNTIVRPATGLNAASFHQLEVVYNLPAGAGHPTLLIPTRYFTGSVYVFTIGSRLVAPGFSRTTMPLLGNQKVPALVAHAVMPGSTLAVGVDGPPVVASAPAAAPNVPAPFPTASVAAMIAAGFLALLVFGLRGWVPALARADGRLDLQRERSRLVGAIAELDLLHARGGMADEEYRRRRSQQKSRLLDVARQLGE